MADNLSGTVLLIKGAFQMYGAILPRVFFADAHQAVVWTPQREPAFTFVSTRLPADAANILLIVYKVRIVDCLKLVQRLTAPASVLVQCVSKG